MKGVKAILLAAGNGERFKDPVPKQFHLLAGKPLYRYSYDTLIESKLFETVIFVCHPDWINKIDIPAISGGQTRQQSVYCGLKAAGPDTDIVVIHEAVRPFVTQRILKENIETAQTYGACDTCIPSADTLVTTIDGKLITHIPNRVEMRRGQTPQSFQYNVILEAHQKARTSEATDDCKLTLDLGHPVHIVEGEEHNIKITTETDFNWALSIINKD